jgi:predicted nuclease with TOPRIM domain
MHLEARVGKVERRVDATLKIVQTGMRLLVKLQQENAEFRKDIKEFKREVREFKQETRRAIHALIEAQMRTDAKLDRLSEKVEALAEAQSRNERSIAELTAAQKRTDARLNKFLEGLSRSNGRGR